MSAARVGTLALALALALAASVGASRLLFDDQEIGTKRIGAPKPPVYPSRYVLNYTFSMPHLALSQADPLSFPVTVWYDEPNGKQRIDTYNGLDSILTIGDDEYTIFPRINELRCAKFSYGPIKSAANDIHSMLPNLAHWDFGGEAKVAGQPAYVWLYQQKDDNKVSQYAFYASPEGVPLRFNMVGFNYITSAHFDEYLYDFTGYTPEPPNDVVFAVPELCSDASKLVVLSDRHSVAAQHAALARPLAGLSYDEETAYHFWSRGFRRHHDSHEEYKSSLERFKEVASMVREHNAKPGQLYKMKLNQFADWHQDDFRKIMPGRMIGQYEGKELPDSYKPLGKFKGTKSRSQLPKHVDWRGTGADPGVKDQGMCGSCFSFSATGAMEGAWYVQTGERRSFSEQQIIDCSWDYGPNGCGGGDYQPVFNYVAQNGGIATGMDYNYASEDQYCRVANYTMVGKFDGYYQIESRDELSVMEAVHTFGPLAVAVDAEPDGFRFYSEGVFDYHDCATKSADLDHAVVLFGYGTSGDGVDYWLVRNSWAKFYGDDGYIKIRRGPHDCGISTDANIAVVAASAVRPGVAEAKRLEAVRAW